MLVLRADPARVRLPPLQLTRYCVMAAPLSAADPQVTMTDPVPALPDTLLGAPGRPAPTVGFGSGCVGLLVGLPDGWSGGFGRRVVGSGLRSCGGCVGSDEGTGSLGFVACG